jgi:hypothetical protein
MQAAHHRHQLSIYGRQQPERRKHQRFNKCRMGREVASDGHHSTSDHRQKSRINGTCFLIIVLLTHYQVYSYCFFFMIVLLTPPHCSPCRGRRGMARVNATIFFRNLWWRPRVLSARQNLWGRFVWTSEIQSPLAPTRHLLTGAAHCPRADTGSDTG